MKIFDCVNEFLINNRGNIKEHTYFYYKYINEHYIQENFNLVTIANFDKVLKEYFETFSKAYSSAVALVVKSLLNQTLRYMNQSGAFINDIHIQYKNKKSPVRQIDCLRIEEQGILEKYILEAKRIYFYGMIVSLHTGLRIGELLALKWENVDFDNRVFTVQATTTKISRNHKVIEIEDLPKTVSSCRVIPITPFLIRIFKELRKHSQCEYVVTNRVGKKMDLRTYQQSFSTLLKKLGIKHYGFHALRHTFATRLLEKNVDIKTISELLGHSSPIITLNRYVHTNLDKKRKALQKL